MEHEDKSAFVARLEETAARAGGVAELAKKSGLSRRMIDRYRSGADPTRESLVSLARAGGVTVSWLAAGEGPRSLEDLATAAADQEGAIPEVDELDEILRLVSRPGAVRSYGTGRVSVQVILNAIMQHALESGWPAEKLARVARIGAILYQIEDILAVK